MTHNPTRYRRLRAEGYRARDALAIARDEAQAFLSPGETETWTDGPWTFTATATWDDYPDTSWLGRFTDRWEPDAIPTNGDRGECAWFVPENPGRAEIPYYRRAGMGRHDAWLKARELDRDALARARAPEHYIVTVTAEGPFGIGEATVGRVDDSYPYAYLSTLARELADEARHDAEASAVRRMARAFRTADAIIEGVPA